MLTNSLAGSKTKYVELMMRIKEDGNIKIQAEGKKVNRDYGVSCTIEKDRFDSLLKDYFKTLAYSIKSVAENSNKFYHSARATFYNNGHDIHFQIKSPIIHNREYGASFSIPTLNLPSDLIGFLKLELYS
jgi:hypothetical protein